MSSSICTDLSFTQDCIDPFDIENLNLWVKLEHLGRYLFAADFLRRYRSETIADIAFGIGYGIPELAQISNTVIAVDQNPEVLKTAKINVGNSNSLKQSNVHFHQHDLESLPWPPSLLNSLDVDAIVCFETLEHLLEPDLVLDQFAKALKERGFLICSVPNVLHDPSDKNGLPVNSYHKQFFNFSSFRHLLQKQGFQVIYRVVQASSNILFKRESQFLKHGIIQQRLGNFPTMHTPDLIRHLTYLLAYPTVEDIDESYSLIVLAQKI